MNKQIMWVLVVVALLVGLYGGYAYEKSKLTSQMMMAESSLQKQLDDANMKNDQLMKAQPTGNDMMMTSPTPTGMMMHTNITPTGAMMQK